jgi:hypothetical protein
MDGVEGWMGTVISGPDNSLGTSTFIPEDEINLVKSGYEVKGL